MNVTFVPNPPIAIHKVLLHVCCAPCSSAIVECLLNNGIRPTLFFYNPNIFPQEEYLRRKAEVVRYAAAQQLELIDRDGAYDDWRAAVAGYEHDPERGRRCIRCFEIRLRETAHYAAEHGFELFATTLATSRWKSVEQIMHAGRLAEQAYPGTTFWAENWRKGGLQERRSELIRLYDFYNQDYCGCEFSITSYKRNCQHRKKVVNNKSEQ